MNVVHPALLVLALALVSWTAQGAGSAQAGKEKAATCSACHGPDGNSLQDIYPQLAGQHAAYLEAQLRAYQTGTRQNALMAPMAVSLSAQDIADLAAFYAQQPPQPGTAREELVELGKRVYRVGNSDSGAPACTACHGPGGNGNPLAGYPKLAGQHPAYSVTQLKAYRTGERVNAVMQAIAARLSDPEINAVADYMHGLYETP